MAVEESEHRADYEYVDGEPRRLSRGTRRECQEYSVDLETRIVMGSVIYLCVRHARDRNYISAHEYARFISNESK
jgi:hypothetical protein